MRKLAILTFVSLDGVMQAPSVPEEDFSGGFTEGGWARPYWEEVMAQVAQEAMAQPYDLLLGRHTYDSFVSSFADAPPDNPVVQKLNAATKYVVSSQDNLSWKNSEIITGNIVDKILALKKADGPLLQVHGSWELVQTLLKYKLVDEYRLWTFPVILGKGKRLFADGAVPNDLRLIKSAPCEGGALMSFYSQK